MTVSKLEFLEFCLSHIGISYIWGGSDPDVGLDCSGLVQILLKKLNLDPPGDQTAEDLHKWCGKKYVPYAFAELGDLVFFGKPDNTAHHVGLYLLGGIMIEAAGGGPDIRTVTQALVTGARVQCNRVMRRKDYLGICRLEGVDWTIKKPNTTA